MELPGLNFRPGWGAQNIDLNIAQPVLEQDLNEAPIPDDPQQMLIHPLHPMFQGNQHMVDAEINIQQPVQPEALMEEVAEIQPVIEPPAQLIPGQQINYLPLEIPVDELMDDLELQNLQNQEDAQGMVGPNGGNIIINNIHLGMIRIEDNFIQPCLKNNLFPPMPVAMPEIVVPHSKGMLETQNSGQISSRFCLDLLHILSGPKSFFRPNSPQ
jgi:hypothetical protein